VRALLIGAGLMAIALPLTGVPMREPLVLAAALLLLLAIFCSFGVVVGVFAESWDQSAFVTNLVILPASFLGGVVLLRRQAAVAVARDLHANPLYYLIDAVRHGFLGQSDVPVGISLAVAADARSCLRGVERLAVSPRRRLEALTTGQVFELNVPNALTVFRILLVPVLVAALLVGSPSGDSWRPSCSRWRRSPMRWTAGSRGATGARARSQADGPAGRQAAGHLRAGVARGARRLSARWRCHHRARAGRHGPAQLAHRAGHVMGASIWGKLKTIAQIAMVLCLIAVDARSCGSTPSVYATVAITVLSGRRLLFGLRGGCAQPPPSSQSRIVT
jgi:phosphatidylglycerophosphate synthase